MIDVSPLRDGTDVAGVATAIDGDTLVIGSNSTERGRLLAGAAYVFVRDGVNWTLQAKLVPNDPVAIHYFGWAVDVSGEPYLDLEREAFLKLLGTRKTQERIAYTLKTGKPLRN